MPCLSVGGDRSERNSEEVRTLERVDYVGIHEYYREWLIDPDDAQLLAVYSRPATASCSGVPASFAISRRAVAFVLSWWR